MCNQRALGWAGGPRRIDQERRVVGTCRNYFQRIRCLLEQWPECQLAFGFIIASDDCLKLRQNRLHRLQHGQVIIVRDYRFHAAVPQPIFDRIRPEQDRQGQGDSADLVGREVRDGGLGALEPFIS